MPDLNLWTPQQIADAWNSINATDRTIGAVIVGGAFVRFVVVPLIEAWRRRG